MLVLGLCTILPDVRPGDLARRIYHSPLLPSWVRALARWVRALARRIFHSPGRRARKQLLASINLPPTTFNEKVRYRMATDRRRILTIFADKVAVREYVSEKVGDHVLTQLYEVTSDPETLVRSKLPREFVLKASHGWSGVIIVSDHAPRERRLPRLPGGWEYFHVHPESLDWDRLVECCRYWLGLRYLPHTEWAYSKVKPRILVEELLVCDGRIPTDYKFMVFGGKVGLIWVDQDRFVEHRRNLYSPRWERLDVEFAYPRGPLDPRPAKLDEMIAVAERLGDQIDFMRADLYNVGERVVFGEITNYPEGGKASFDPPEFDQELGALWAVEGRRRLPWLGRLQRLATPS